MSTGGRPAMRARRRLARGNTAAVPIAVLQGSVDPASDKLPTGMSSRRSVDKTVSSTTFSGSRDRRHALAAVAVVADRPRRQRERVVERRVRARRRRRAASGTATRTTAAMRDRLRVQRPGASRGGIPTRYGPGWPGADSGSRLLARAGGADEARLARVAMAPALLLQCAVRHARASSRAGIAQIDDEPDSGPTQATSSPERFIVEFRVGPVPARHGRQRRFETFFNDDSARISGVELDAHRTACPRILYLTGGGGIGTLDFSGARASRRKTGQRQRRDHAQPAAAHCGRRRLARRRAGAQALGAVHLHRQARLRVGALVDRQRRRNGRRGWSVGPLWAAQLALDLDTSSRAARATWTRNGASTTRSCSSSCSASSRRASSLPIGDSSWSAGLGFVF